MKKERNIYLDNIDFHEAFSGYLKIAKDNLNLRKVEVEVKSALGYITSEAVYARASSPNYTASAVDGIAVNFKSTEGASITNEVTLVEGRDFLVVDTGDYVPSKYNAVIMVEETIEVQPGEVKIIKPAAFFENIRSVGEDIVKSEMILPSFHRLRPVDIGALLAGGIKTIKVIDPLRIGILPTGTEIVDVSNENLKKGDIIDSNSYMIKASLEEIDQKPTVYNKIKDDYELIKQQVLTGLDKEDIFLIIAGSSAGREDYTKRIIAEIGEVFIHGVAIKPGKPVILGLVNKKLVIGIPGYPVSCYIVLLNIILPIIKELLHIEEKPRYLEATLTRRIYSSLKHLEFVRMKVGLIDDKWVATPLKRGAGTSMSLVDCDGYLEIPKEKEGYDALEKVRIKLVKDKNLLENNIVSIGSHDLLLDIVNDILIRKDYPYKVSSSHVGSISGVLAMKNNETLIAPIHILDEKTGEYNLSAIKKFLPEKEFVLIKGVKRLQGLMVKKGNPKGISTFKDIINHRYINRQQGSGTNLLFEYLIKENNLDKKSIVGNDFYLKTHFDVAANIKEDNGDCGLGIYSIAKILDLDFIEVAHEDYDFLIQKKYLDSKRIQSFIKILKSDTFRERVEELGGYTLENIGEIIEVH